RERANAATRSVLLGLENQLLDPILLGVVGHPLLGVLLVLLGLLRGGRLLEAVFVGDAQLAEQRDRLHRAVEGPPNLRGPVGLGQRLHNEFALLGGNLFLLGLGGAGAVAAVLLDE